MSDKPLISVIMPMYNAERFIRQSVGSVLGQTYPNVELIIIDDCSTDRSVETVEKIMSESPRGEIIKLLRRERNSGGSAVPRNVGLRYAHGEYIAFLDNDDQFTKTALEEMSAAAEQWAADVVHSPKYFSMANDDAVKLVTLEALPTVDAPELLGDIGDRVGLFTRRRLYWHVWSKLFRRDFLSEHCLEFRDIRIADDLMFCFECMCLARRYVRVPNVFNIYRVRRDSASHQSTGDEFLIRLIRIMIEGTRMLDEFMDGVSYFVEHPEARSAVIRFFLNYHIVQTARLCGRRTPTEIESLFRREFGSELGSNTGLTSNLFHLVNVQAVQLTQLQREKAQLSARLEANKQ